MSVEWHWTNNKERGCWACSALPLHNFHQCWISSWFQLRKWLLGSVIKLLLLLTFLPLQFILWFLIIPVAEAGGAGAGLWIQEGFGLPPRPGSPAPFPVSLPANSYFTSSKSCGCSGPALKAPLLIFTMISLTETRDDPLSADMSNLLLGDLNWANTDIWHQIQPTELSGSWEAESRGRKGDFCSHHLRMETGGWERAPPPVPMGTAHWRAEFSPADCLCLCQSKRMFNCYGNKPATSYIFFSLPEDHREGDWGFELCRDLRYFPPKHTFQPTLLMLCFFNIFPVFHLLSMFFLSWQW